MTFISHHAVYRFADDGKLEEAVFSRAFGETDTFPYTAMTFDPSDSLYEDERIGLTWHHEGIPFQFFNTLSSIFPRPTR